MVRNNHLVDERYLSACARLRNARAALRAARTDLVNARYNLGEVLDGADWARKLHLGSNRACQKSPAGICVYGEDQPGFEACVYCHGLMQR